MAITFNSAAQSTSNNYTHTVAAGSDRYAVVITGPLVAGPAVSSVTFGGVPLSLIATRAQGSSGNVTIWGGFINTTGANTVSFTGGNPNHNASAVYNGVPTQAVPYYSLQQVDESGGTVTTTVTSVNADDWAIAANSGQRFSTAGSNCTLRAGGSPTAAAIFDSNGGVAVGNFTQVQNITSPINSNPGFAFMLKSAAPVEVGNTSFFPMM